MYNPDLGRFLQTDPTGFDAGDMNLFRYCGDEPVDRSDPTGLDTEVRLEYYLMGQVATFQWGGVMAAFHPYGHQNLVIQDTSSGQFRVNRGAPNERWDESSFRGYLRAARNLPQPSGTGIGNVKLRSDLKTAKDHVDPLSGEKTKVVPGSKKIVKDDFKAVESKVERFNETLNGARLDYYLRSINSNAAAGTGYRIITDQTPPVLDSLPGGEIDLRPMLPAGKSNK
jgi:hypothetical protein